MELYYTPACLIRQKKPKLQLIFYKPLEDIEDLKLLEDMRKKPLKFRPLEEFIKEYSPDV
jgi:hypothetical protein